MLFVLHDGFVNETNEFHISVEKVHNFTAPDCNTGIVLSDRLFCHFFLFSISMMLAI